MKVLLVANPNAGGKRSSKLIEPVCSKITRAGIAYELLLSEYPGHIKDLMKDVNPGDFDSILIQGGDGTNFELLNGLLTKEDAENIPPLGIIPVGSGNSFARDLNIFSWEDGLEALQKGENIAVDICSFSQLDEIFYFVNLMGFGFVTDVAVTAEKWKFLGDTSYLMGIFHRLLNLKTHFVRMEVDGKVLEGENLFVEFCNSRYTGGSMMMAPEAKINDGLMDIIICDPLSRLSLLSTLPKLFKGTHGENPSVHFMQAREVKIETNPIKTLLPDGELFGITPTEISILPGKLRYYTK